MRRLLVLLMLLLPVLPAAGCGQSRPDPRDNPDFVDTSDPDAIGGMMEKPDASGRLAPTKGESAAGGASSAEKK